MSESSDEQLIAAYLAGNERSLEVLIRRYLKPIYGFTRRYASNTADAEDVTQEVFVKAWRNIKKFDQRKSFKTWIFSIAKNARIDHLRKSGRTPFIAIGGEADRLVGATGAVFREVCITKRLVGALHCLNTRYRAVLRLYYEENLNFREIAEAVGESVNTVKSRHRRALVILRRLLA